LGTTTPQERREMARAERTASERRLAEATAAAKPARDSYLVWWCRVVVLRSAHDRD
jgi:hypothetical protein